MSNFDHLYIVIGADAGRAYDDNIDENTYGGVAQLIYVTV